MGDPGSGATDNPFYNIKSVSCLVVDWGPGGNWGQGGVGVGTGDRVGSSDFLEF